MNFSIGQIIKEEFLISFPAMCYYFLLNSVTLIGLSFLAKEHNENMIDGIGVTNMWFECVYFAFLDAANSGLETLCSNSILTRKYKLIGYYFHRARIVCYALSIILGIIHGLTIKLVIKAFRGDKEIVSYGVKYAFPQIVLALLIYPQFDATTRLLGIMEKNFINLFNSIISVLLLVLFDYIFINKMGLKIFGFVLAQIIYYFINMLLGTLYLKLFHPYPQANFMINKQSFKWEGILNYLKFTVGSGALELLTVVGDSVMTVCAVIVDKKFHDSKGNWFPSFVIFEEIAYSLSAIPLALDLAITVILGKMTPLYPVRILKKTAVITIVFGVIIMIFPPIIISICRNPLVNLFATDNESREKLLKLIPYLCGTVFCYIYIFIVSVYKGLGKQKFASIFLFFNTYILIPGLCLLLGITAKGGIIGLCKGLVIGNVISSAVFAGGLFFVDFEEAKKEANDRIDEEERALEIIKEDLTSTIKEKTGKETSNLVNKS